MSVLIRGGRIVTATDDYVGDVYVEGEQVSLIGRSLEVDADVVIDASGKLVLPGAIDPHTHLDMPFGGTVTVDDFTSGQTAAAFGGTTCHIDFAIQSKGQSFTAAIDEWSAKASGKAVIDYGFHIIVTDLEEGGTLDELATLPDRGVTSYKMLMAYKGVFLVDDETLFRVMELAARTGALAMIHGENGEVIDVLVKRAVAEGRLEPRYHALTRPPELEGEATNRAIQIAHVAGAPLYVVHVTCKESVDAIASARAKGWDVWGETCTQYFFVDITDLDEPDFGGAKYVFSPPVRDKANQPVLWDAVRTDVLSAISTDHCAFTLDGQKTLGRDDFSKIPNGAPGLEDRLRMIHHFGVNEGRISLEPHGGPALDERGPAVRPLSQEGHHRPGLGRRHRHLRPEPQDDDQGGRPALEIGLQPVRGHRGHRRRRHRAHPRHRRRRRRRADGRAGLRPVRRAGEVRRGATERVGPGVPGPNGRGGGVRRG